VRGNPLARCPRCWQRLGRRSRGLLSVLLATSLTTSRVSTVHRRTAPRSEARGRSGRTGISPTATALGRLTVTPAGPVARASKLQSGGTTSRGAVVGLGPLHGRSTGRGRGVATLGLAIPPLAGTEDGWPSALARLCTLRTLHTLRTPREGRGSPFLLGLATSQRLFLASLLKGSLLQHLLTLLFSLLLELGELLLACLLPTALLFLLAGRLLLGLAELALLLLTLALLAETSVANLLLTDGNLLLEFSLSITAALLKLITTTLMERVAEGLVLGHQAAKPVLELDTLLVLLLCILEGLGLDLLIDGAVLLDLLGMVLVQLLGLLLTEGTFKMVESLASDAKTLVDIVLLPLQLGQLHGTKTVAVKVVEILKVDVNSLIAHLEISDLLLELLLANTVTLSLETLGFTLLLLGSKSLVLGLLQSLLAESLLASILLLLASLDLGCLLLALLNDFLSGEDLQMLLLSTSLGTGKSRGAGLKALLVQAGINVVAGSKERLGKTSELGTNNLGGSTLETLNSAGLRLGRSSTGSAVASLGGREDVVVEAKDAGGMVHADRKITLLVTVHDELLNSAASDLVRLGELGQALNEREVNSFVDLRELLEETGKDDLLQRKNVLLHLSIGTNLGQDRRDLLADRQGVEVNLKDVVQISDLGASTVKEGLGKGIPEESGTSGSLGHAKEVSQAGVLVLSGLVKVNHGTAGSRGADDRNGEGGEEDERGSLLEIGLRRRGVVGLLALAAGNQDGGLTEESVVSRPSSSVEQIVLADEEDSGELLVVVGHHDVLGGSLAEVQQGVDVLNTSESLLPELELDGNVKLLETGLKVSLKSVWVAQVDGVHLRRVLGRGLDMVAEQLAETSELGLASVLEAEVEGLGSGALVEDLQTGIVSENVEDSSVGLPEELEPRSDDRPVCAVSGLFTRDGGKEDRLGSLTRLEIVDAGGGGGSLNALLDLIGLLLGGGDLLDGELDELFQDQLHMPMLAPNI
jgi:hypothetical protein